MGKSKKNMSKSKKNMRKTKKNNNMKISNKKKTQIIYIINQIKKKFLIK